jgi:hypothetical protein
MEFPLLLAMILLGVVLDRSSTRRGGLVLPSQQQAVLANVNSD